ncbi:ARL14 effector protein [Drosophila subobscura]|uniref:ARL14 effector protein n=1 Tax=Drosophila subobscura TaxID=7241 RepID=UPI00155A86D0|nr:ARL14 effector protein [Drosophila subobscura]
MSSDIDPDYSTRRLRQRQTKKGESNDDNVANESEKNKRRGKKRGQHYGKNSAYDEYGIIRYNGLDICDCMSAKCDGCWYECQCCGSTRCGPTCRANRKFFYEGINYDGKDLSITNQFLPK